MINIMCAFASIESNRLHDEFARRENNASDAKENVSIMQY